MSIQAKTCFTHVKPAPLIRSRSLQAVSGRHQRKACMPYSGEFIRGGLGGGVGVGTGPPVGDGVGVSRESVGVSARGVIASPSTVGVGNSSASKVAVGWIGLGVGVALAKRMGRWGKRHKARREPSRRAAIIKRAPTRKPGQLFPILLSHSNFITSPTLARPGTRKRCWSRSRKGCSP